MFKKEEQQHVFLNGVKVVSPWPERLRAAQEVTHYTIGETDFRRVLFGDESGPTHGNNTFACHDCTAVSGQFHVPGCDVEQCPACGGQSIGCDCQDEDEATECFDFQKHRTDAVATYLMKRGVYDELCEVIKDILREALDQRGIRINSIQTRSKDPVSFGRKAGKPSEENPSEPKYPTPLEEITDLAGARIITFAPSMIVEIDKLIYEEFEVIERLDKGEKLIAEERFGYNSIHYLIKLSTKRSSLPEYAKLSNLTAEIQVRTILQHAWAEIEHDIQYKSTSVIPVDIRRRFIALAGMMEVADREFQAAQDEDQRLRQHARDMIKNGEIDEVEITPDALKAFLSRKVGADQRIS